MDEMERWSGDMPVIGILPYSRIWKYGGITCFTLLYVFIQARRTVIA